MKNTRNILLEVYVHALRLHRNPPRHPYTCYDAVVDAKNRFGLYFDQTRVIKMGDIVLRQPVNMVKALDEAKLGVAVFNG